jgi:hypothetical protein
VTFSVTARQNVPDSQLGKKLANCFVEMQISKTIREISKTILLNLETNKHL